MKYLLLTVLVVNMGCCSPIATYPPIEVDPAVVFSNANHEPVPTLLVTIIEYARDHFGGLETVVYNLPDGIGGETYDVVTSRLSGAKPMQNDGELAYHITELRVRGFRAEASVTFPRGGGYETATLYLSKSLSRPWVVMRERVWVIPSVEAPEPNYVPTEQARAVETN
jgi:hypothetical protein